MKPARSVVVVSVVGFVLAAALSLTRGFPIAPEVHDEFSYLLLADTLVHGRLANPPHPMWEHFESFHVLQQPTYASKYPPFPALTLAIGQLVSGEPTVGVWIGFAILCGTLTWMLQGWAPRPWDLWGGLFAAMWLVSLPAGNGYWASSFWGGAAAATGAALVLGGLRRMIERRSTWGSVAMGLGVGVLAGSRPFEGALTVIAPSCVILAWIVAGMRKPTRSEIVRLSLAALVPLLCVVGFLGYYNFRITGSVARFPYMAYEQQYDTLPLLRMLHVSSPPTYRHEAMRDYYSRRDSIDGRQSTISRFVKVIWRDSEPLRKFLFPFFVIPLLFLTPWALRDRWTLLAMSVCLLVGGGFLVVPWIWEPHYAAPLFTAYLLVLIRAARHVAALRFGRERRGRALVLLIGGCAAASAAVSIAARIPTRGARQMRWEWQRQKIERELAGSGPRHLVIVEYGAKHDPDREWVYNGADIDGSPVVWARAMSDAKDAEMLDYFSERRAWKLCVGADDGPFTLRPVNRTGETACPPS